MPDKTGRFSIYSDEELMGCVNNGEVAAFDELYFRYSGRLLRYFERMMNFNTARAEDALQDLFMKIATNPEKFDRSRTFKTWVFSVASNCCKNFYRHLDVERRGHNDIIHNTYAKPDNAFLELASKMDGSLFMKRLNEALNELPEEKKEAFILKYQEEKSIAEIAVIQQCPEGSVKSRLHYALKMLEEKLKIFKPN
jgi:RNA polymerase sigma-70 factor (ECF subfamily)